MKKRAFQYAAWAALAAIVFVTVSPIGWRPHDLLPVNVDRALAFGLLAGLFVAAYPKRWASVAILLVAGAGMIEMLQLFSPTRHAQVEDAVVKATGALIGVAVAVAFNLARAHLATRWKKPATTQAKAQAELMSMLQLPVKSKAIEAVYFGPHDGRLRIRFHNGEERLFGGVSEVQAEALVTAPSPGHHYIEHIRKQFPRLAA